MVHANYETGDDFPPQFSVIEGGAIELLPQERNALDSLKQFLVTTSTELGSTIVEQDRPAVAYQFVRKVMDATANKAAEADQTKPIIVSPDKMQESLQEIRRHMIGLDDKDSVHQRQAFEFQDQNSKYAAHLAHKFQEIRLVDLLLSATDKTDDWDMHDSLLWLKAAYGVRFQNMQGTQGSNRGSGRIPIWHGNDNY